MWPSSLPDTFESKSYSSEVTDTYIETEMEFGPKKRRQRFTGVLENISGSMVLSSAQLLTLKNFHRVTCGGGVLPFTFKHPETGSIVIVRFAGAPKTTHLGGEYFSSSLSFEVI